jgi:small multidrug resistance pump
MKPHVALIIAILSEVVATSALKASESFTRIVPSLIVVAGYGISFYFLSVAMRTIPLGVAYAIWSGLGSALIVFVSWLLFKQALDAPAFLGISMIIAGSVILNVFSKASVH